MVLLVSKEKFAFSMLVKKKELTLNCRSKNAVGIVPRMNHWKVDNYSG